MIIPKEGRGVSVCAPQTGLYDDVRICTCRMWGEITSASETYRSKLKHNLLGVCMYVCVGMHFLICMHESGRK